MEEGHKPLKGYKMEIIEHLKTELFVEANSADDAKKIAAHKALKVHNDSAQEINIIETYSKAQMKNVEKSKQVKAELANANLLFQKLENLLETTVFDDEASFCALLRCIAFFPGLSVRNAYLLYEQKPNALLLDSYDHWISRGKTCGIGQVFKKGTSAIRLLTKEKGGGYYKTEKYFDIMQTNFALKPLQVMSPDREAILHGLFGLGYARIDSNPAGESYDKTEFLPLTSTICLRPISGLDTFANYLGNLLIEFALSVLANGDASFDRVAHECTATIAGVLVLLSLGLDIKLRELPVDMKKRYEMWDEFSPLSYFKPSHFMELTALNTAQIFDRLQQAKAVSKTILAAIKAQGVPLFYERFEVLPAGKECL